MTRRKRNRARTLFARDMVRFISRFPLKDRDYRGVMFYVRNFYAAWRRPRNPRYCIGRGRGVLVARWRALHDA